MEKRDEADDEMDEFMLPGFRFHPTDQELVGFYLTRKIQQKPVCIELIKQLDIYKYDPWDLSMFATNGEKEWYFYCPRDRKYRNSTRPNRVTRAGFWKATGTDRSIYSTQSSKCIGLKKSLVFYKGKAAKGTKTDWMMHEFRLPSLSDSTNSPNRYFANNIPASEAWAICRIFKKANSSTKRALSHSWASPASDSTNPANSINNIQFCSSSIIMANKANTTLQFSFCNDIQHSSMECKSSSVPLLNGDHFKYPISHTFSSSECAINDASSLLPDMSTSILCDYENGSDNMELSTFHNQFDGLSATLSEDMHENLNFGYEEERSVLKEENVGQLYDELGSVVRSIELPCSFALSSPDLMWDSSPSPCHYSTFPLTSAILE